MHITFNVVAVSKRMRITLKQRPSLIELSGFPPPLRYTTHKVVDTVETNRGNGLPPMRSNGAHCEDSASI